MVFTEEKRPRLVFTIPDRCRVCYTCVRECPARAIRIENGQAAVMHERCIACGNCVKVCSQGAKAYLFEEDLVTDFLNDSVPVFALLAPSFPAEFSELENPALLVGALRKMGFSRVFEVGFGADLVANRFHQLIHEENSSPLINSDCPAIVQYIEHYHPDLVENLAPLVSPMVAMSRVVRSVYSEPARFVFIGPCIGKKAESREIDAGITFLELREMLMKRKISFESENLCDFDYPKAGKGGIFPVKRGMLQTLDMPEDLFEGRIVVAEGKSNFIEAIAAFENGSVAGQNMELLCCEGCIMGPGMSDKQNRFQRSSRVGRYMRTKMESMDHDQWRSDMKRFADLDLSRSFKASDLRLETPDELLINEVLESMGKHGEKDHLNCGACGYESCRSHAIAIVQGLAEPDMCLPNVIEKLATTQKALKHSEKLAHMGQLSAGIAHELNNPLGVVIMYANLLLDEHKENQMAEDLQLIVSQADRCKRIVGNLLNFARKNQLRKELVEMSQLLSDSFKSVLIPGGITTSLLLPEERVFADIDREQLMQVLTNLYKNAVEAMSDGGTLEVKLEQKSGETHINIRDTGTGIAEEDMDKLFTPFFTTKEFGMGTGLGLATSYGIIKMHKGKIEVNSNTDPLKGQTGSCFHITLPGNE